MCHALPCWYCTYCIWVCVMPAMLRITRGMVLQSVSHTFHAASLPTICHWVQCNGFSHWLKSLHCNRLFSGSELPMIPDHIGCLQVWLLPREKLILMNLFAKLISGNLQLTRLYCSTSLHHGVQGATHCTDPNRSWSVAWCGTSLSLVPMSNQNMNIVKDVVTRFMFGALLAQDLRDFP